MEESQKKSRIVYGLEALDDFADQAKEFIDKTSNTYPFNYHLSRMVIESILNSANTESSKPPKKTGIEWINSYMSPSNPSSNGIPFLRSNWTNNEEYHQHQARVMELADLLYNLQLVPPIDAVYRRLVTDVLKTESTVFELECLRLLWLGGVRFLVRETKRNQKNYEYEVLLPDDTRGYCEAKAIDEVRAFSTRTVLNTLEVARKQVPKGECGIVFLKVPDSWQTESLLFRELEEVVKRKLAQTTRITEVIYYSTPWIWTPTHGGYAIAINNTLNARSPHLSKLGVGLVKGKNLLSSSPWVRFGLFTDYETTKQILRGQLEILGAKRQASISE